MKNTFITQFDKKVLSKATQMPKFRTGDRVKVHYKLSEGFEDGKEKFRIQAFEGVVTRIRKGQTDSTFTVRKIAAGGIGVERNFPVISNFIDKVDVISSGAVRRSRLFYLRQLSGKAARIRSKFVSLTDEELKALESRRAELKAAATQVAATSAEATEVPAAKDVTATPST